MPKAKGRTAKTNLLDCVKNEADIESSLSEEKHKATVTECVRLQAKQSR